jgi:hypothetical protein
LDLALGLQLQTGGAGNGSGGRSPPSGGRGRSRSYSSGTRYASAVISVSHSPGNSDCTGTAQRARDFVSGLDRMVILAHNNCVSIYEILIAISKAQSVSSG